MQKNKEALMQYVDEIKNLRSLILNDLAASGTGTGQSLVSDTSADKNPNSNSSNPNNDAPQSRT